MFKKLRSGRGGRACATALAVALCVFASAGAGAVAAAPAPAWGDDAVVERGMGNNWYWDNYWAHPDPITFSGGKATVERSLV